MSALSREIGTRCRTDAVAAASAGDEPAPEPNGEESQELAALRSDLGALRLMALHKRAVSEGVSGDAVEDAMDGDDPKASLISLVVDVALRRGPADRLVTALVAGEGVHRKRILTSSAS